MRAIEKREMSSTCNSELQLTIGSAWIERPIFRRNSQSLGLVVKRPKNAKMHDADFTFASACCTYYQSAVVQRAPHTYVSQLVQHACTIQVITMALQRQSDCPREKYILPYLLVLVRATANFQLKFRYCITFFCFNSLRQSALPFHSLFLSLLLFSSLFPSFFFFPFVSLLSPEFLQYILSNHFCAVSQHFSLHFLPILPFSLSFSFFVRSFVLPFSLLSSSLLFFLFVFFNWFSDSLPLPFSLSSPFFPLFHFVFPTLSLSFHLFFIIFFSPRPTFFLFTLSSSFFFIRSFRSYVYVFMYFASRVLSSWIYLRYVNTTLHWAWM